MKNTVRKIPESVEYQVGKTSTACDTAWAAQLIGKVGTPVFSECIQWLSGFQSLNRMDCCAQGCYGKLISVLNSLGLKGADGRCEHIRKREIHGTLKKVELSTSSCTGLYTVKELYCVNEVDHISAVSKTVPYSHVISPYERTELWMKKVWYTFLVVSAEVGTPMWATAGKLCSRWSA